MVTIKRIEVVSAMRVGALVSALIFTVFGLFFFGLQALLVNVVSSSITTSSPRGSFSGGNFAAVGLVGLCVFYLVGVVFSAITGGIYGAVGAFIYNLVSNWVGGIRVEVDSTQRDLGEKRKREVVVEQPPSSSSPTGF